VADAQTVKELRERTGAGFMECKRALEASGDNVEKAITHLREKGLANALKKAGRQTNEGKVHSYIHAGGRIGVLVEINCETDFVARTDDFQSLVTDVAMHVAAASPRYLTKEEVPAEVVDSEKSILKAQAASSGKQGPVIDKIVEGRINKFYEEVCLLQQRFVKDPDKTIETLVKEAISKLGENISVRRFARFQLGDGAKTE